MSVKPRGRNARLLVVTLVIVSAITITVDFREGETGPLEGLGRTALSIMTPLQEAVSKITHPIGDFFSAIASLPTLKKRNEELTQEVAQLQSQLATAATTEADLAELRKLVDLQPQIGGTTTAANVISNGVSNFEWSITVDKGTDDGIAVGDAVVASAGLVGRVDRVTGGSADVQLITDPDSGVLGKLVDTGQQGVVLGEGENDMQMRLIDAATPSSELNGKVVETAGYRAGNLTNLYPRGLVIGRISRVLDSAGELDKFVTVAPAVDLSSLDIVLVVHSESAG